MDDIHNHAFIVLLEYPTISGLKWPVHHTVRVQIPLVKQWEWFATHLRLHHVATTFFPPTILFRYKQFKPSAP